MTVIESPVTLDTTSDQGPTVKHIIRKDDMMRGYVLGDEIEALCGHRFIPTRDPDKYPWCDACREAVAKLF